MSSSQIQIFQQSTYQRQGRICPLKVKYNGKEYSLITFETKEIDDLLFTNNVSQIVTEDDPDQSIGRMGRKYNISIQAISKSIIGL